MSLSWIPVHRIAAQPSQLPSDECFLGASFPAPCFQSVCIFLFRVHFLSIASSWSWLSCLFHVCLVYTHAHNYLCGWVLGSHFAVYFLFISSYFLPFSCLLMDAWSAFKINGLFFRAVLNLPKYRAERAESLVYSVTTSSHARSLSSSHLARVSCTCYTDEPVLPRHYQLESTVDIRVPPRAVCSMV